MKSFYSILYCPIRPTASEQVSIALIMQGDGGIFFKYSQNKLSAISKLLPKEAYELLRTNLKSIEDYFHREYSNKTILNPADKLLKESYFDYLSVYSNNLLTFSKPKRIDLPATADFFNKLFVKYVFEETRAEYSLPAINGINFPDKERAFKSAGIDLIDTLKDRVSIKIQSHVNLDIELNSQQIPNLTIPTKVWFIGNNDAPITGEAFKFNSNPSRLKNELHSYLYLLDKLMENKPRGKYFVIGNEPAKNKGENHQIWKDLRTLDYITYLPEQEAESILESYMEDHHIKPLFNYL